MAYKNKYIVSGFRSDVRECLENDLTILSFSLEDIEPKWSIESTTDTYTVCAYSLDVEGRLYEKNNQDSLRVLIICCR